MWKSALWASGVLALSMAVTYAETPKPFPKFEAKRIKVPSSSHKGPRITVQIGPAAAVEKVPDPSEPATQSTTASHAWFWDTISPDLSKQNAGRLDTALDLLSTAKPPVATPRLQALQDIVTEHGTKMLLSTVGKDVSPALVLAVIAVESGGDPNAISGAGAEGLMQLMPDTARQLSVTNSFDEAQNITGGVAYLDQLMKTYGGDPILALAAYNAGPGAVQHHSGVPPFAETRAYVPKVLAAYRMARSMCVTPPVFATDGCVFAAMN